MAKPRSNAASPQQYRLTRNSRGWMVRVGVDQHGPYLSRRDALLDAVDAAQAAGELGTSVVILDCSARSGNVVVWRSSRGFSPLADGADRSRQDT